jgi:hypothetical protein
MRPGRGRTHRTHYLRPLTHVPGHRVRPRTWGGCPHPESGARTSTTSPTRARHADIRGQTDAGPSSPSAPPVQCAAHKRRTGGRTERTTRARALSPPSPRASADAATVGRPQKITHEPRPPRRHGRDTPIFEAKRTQELHHPAHHRPCAQHRQRPAHGGRNHSIRLATVAQAGHPLRRVKDWKYTVPHLEAEGRCVRPRHPPTGLGACPCQRPPVVVDQWRQRGDRAERPEAMTRR